MKKSHSQLNFEKLRKIIDLKSKGYWRVKSLDKLNKKILKNNTDIKEALRLKKKIEKIVPKAPPFFKVQQCTRTILPKLQIPKVNSQPNFFITVHTFPKNKKKKKKDNEKDLIDSTIFRNFPHEPYLYNNLPFFAICTYKNNLPRKFNEVVRECRKMQEYEKFLKEKQQLSHREEAKNSLSTPPKLIKKEEELLFRKVKKDITISTDEPLKTGRQIKLIKFNVNRNKKSNENSAKESGETTKQDFSKITSKYSTNVNSRKAKVKTKSIFTNNCCINELNKQNVKL